jgi:PAS domain S-box-containing protein
MDDPLGCGFGQKCTRCTLLFAIEDTIRSGRKHRNVIYRATLNRNGSERQIVLLGSTVRISVAGGYRLLLCLQDITERIRVEQALLESEARFRAIYEHSIAGILLMAPDGRVLAANPAACKILGKAEKAICQPRRSGPVEAQDPQIGALLRNRSKQGHTMGEIKLAGADGKHLSVQIASAAFDTADGPRTSMVFMDMSEKKLAEERIHEFSQKLLSVREEEKHHLSSILHHEIGSAAIGVTVRLKAAEDDLLKGSEKEALASLRECRKVFSRAIANIKNLAVELRPPDLDFLGLGASLRQYFKRIARNSSLKIHFTDAAHSRKILPENQTFLFRAAQECLSNVIKHANAHTVRIRLSCARGQIRLSVSDDGSGFHPGRLTAKTVPQLGLLSMQEVATALKGRMVITANRENGTKVTLSIPEGGSPDSGKG